MLALFTKEVLNARHGAIASCPKKKFQSNNKMRLPKKKLQMNFENIGTGFWESSKQGMRFGARKAYLDFSKLGADKYMYARNLELLIMDYQHVNYSNIDNLSFQNQYFFCINY